jgi:nucleotide-binding universal stress UspA family protein
MTTIFVLTDFSPLASNAMDYAAALAGKTGGGIELVHVYEWPVIYNDRTPEVMPLYLPVEEIRKKAEESLAETRKKFEEKNPGLVVSSICRAGNLVADELHDITEGKDVFAIVCGVHETHGIDTILGSTPLSIIKRSKYVVIGVPGNYQKYLFKKAVLATNLEPVNSETGKCLAGFVEKIGPAVELVKVETENPSEDVFPDEMLNELKVLNPSFKTIEGDDVNETLNNYLESSRADLLILLQHHHNLWEKLFTKSHMKGILETANIPVVIIPDL